MNEEMLQAWGYQTRTKSSKALDTIILVIGGLLMLSIGVFVGLCVLGLLLWIATLLG